VSEGAVGCWGRRRTLERAGLALACQQLLRLPLAVLLLLLLLPLLVLVPSLLRLLLVVCWAL
jgi:hypothetical protein